MLLSVSARAKETLQMKVLVSVTTSPCFLLACHSFLRSLNPCLFLFGRCDKVSFKPAGAIEGLPSSANVLYAHREHRLYEGSPSDRSEVAKVLPGR